MSHQTQISLGGVNSGIGRLIALFGKAQTSRGQYPRSEAEIARELLVLADEHGATFDKGVREALEREAERYRD